MGLDDAARRLTREQPDIWFVQETGHSGTGWRVRQFARIAGAADRDVSGWAIRGRVMRGAESVGAACVEVDGQVSNGQSMTLMSSGWWRW